MKTKIAIASITVAFCSSALSENLDDPTERMFEAATNMCDLLGEQASLALENVDRDPEMVYEALSSYMPTEVVWYDKVHYEMMANLRKTKMKPNEFGSDWQAKCMNKAISAVYDSDAK